MRNNQTRANKPDKPAKTGKNQQMPINTLIQEINQLRNQLSEIKINHNSPPFQDIPQPNHRKITTQSNDSLIETPTHDKTLQKWNIADYQKQILNGFEYQETQVEKKINLTIKKLCKAIHKKNNESSYKYLHRLLGIFDIILKQSKNYNPESMNFYRDSKFALEKQVLNLKEALAHQINKLETKDRQWAQLDAEYKIVIDKYQELFEQYDNSKQVYEGLRIEKEQLEHQCKIYEQQLLKKQEEITVNKQDVFYNLNQSEKHRKQKKQLENLYENLLVEYKELRSAYENNVEKVQKQRDKWKAECQSRRAHQSETIGLSDQLYQAKKQLGEYRKESIKKTSDYNSIVGRLQEQQKKNMTLQSDNYRLTVENQKLICSVEYCKQQMKVLGQQVSQLQQEMKHYEDAFKNSDQMKEKRQKSMMLTEIQEMIRKQKQLENLDC